jgi:transposase-like protein
VKSPRRQWHFLGIQCPQCSSFNTVVEQVVSSGPPAQGDSRSDSNSGAA